MFKIRHLSILALGLVLLLAACGQQTPEVTPAPDGFVKLSIGLDSSNLSTEGITTLGAPYNPADGSIAVDNVAVHIEESDGTAVNFDYDSATNTYTYDPSGTTLYITLAPGSPNNAATVVLPDSFNPYGFESLGYDAASTPNVIAYDSLTQNVSTNSSVTVSLESVLGAATLVPRFPTTVAVPGATIDLMLVVMANGNTTYPTDYLQVPMSDFTASYGPLNNATEMNHSNRGIRIKIANNCTTAVTVKGSVNGLAEQSGNYINDDIDIDGSNGFSLTCSTTTGAVTADLEAPNVTLDSYNAKTGAVSGTADDNYGIGKIQIFDGPTLLASTEPSEQTGGVVDITNTPTGTGNEVTYSANLTLTPLGGITVVVTDQSGNQSTTVETVNLNVVYVNQANTSGNEDGSEAHPFNTIQEGVDAVNADGTVWVAPGVYLEDIVVDDDVTIIGFDASNTIIKAPNQTTAISTPNGDRYAIIEVTGASTVASISNISVRGPFSSNIGCAEVGGAYGVRVSHSATLNLTNANIVDARQDTMLLSGCQGGIGLLVGRQSDGFSGTANLKNVNFWGFQKGGVVVDGSGSSLTMDGGSITGVVTDKIGQNGVQISRGATGTISNVTIEDIKYTPNPQLVAAILLYQSDGVTLENNSINHSDFGIARFQTIGTTVITGNAFANNVTSIYNGTATGLDVSNGNTFNGVDPSTATLSELFVIEDKILHAPDDSSLGLVQVVANNVYVTQSSGSVQLGIDAATTGDTVHVQDGIYAPGAELNLATNSLNLVAETSGGVTLEGGCTSSVVYSAMDITADNVTISGFNIEKYTPENGHVNNLDYIVRVAGNGITLNELTFSTEATCLAGNKAYEILVTGSNVTVKYSTITRLPADHGYPAIFIYGAAADNAIINNNSIQNGAIGAHLAAPTPTLTITDNTIDGSAAEGIWVVGDPIGLEDATLTISGNTITNSDSGNFLKSDIGLHVETTATNTVNGGTDSSQFSSDLSTANNGATVDIINH